MDCPAYSRFAISSRIAAVVFGDVRHPPHHLEDGALELAEAILVLDSRHCFDVDVRLEGRTVLGGLDALQTPLCVARDAQQGMQDQPLLEPVTGEREGECVDDERTVVLEDLDDGIARTVVRVANPHGGARRIALPGPRERLCGQGGEHALTARVMRLDPVQVGLRKGREELAPLGCELRRGLLDQR
jgi:hypothetical protein